MSGLKENMSNGEVLAVVNKNSYLKIQSFINSQILQATLHGFCTHFWYSKVELDKKGMRRKDAKFEVLILKNIKTYVCLERCNSRLKESMINNFLC
jgi:hypothetical protein